MKIPISILGATGMVGQKAIALFENHPTFEIKQLVASPTNVGKTYQQAVQWHEPTPLPDNISKLEIIDIKDITTPYAISSLPGDMAREGEMYLAKKGIHIVSNSKAFRMDQAVPLIIPEINQNHLSLIENQQTSGKIVTNPNCATVFLATGLWPLLQLGKITHVSVVTLQALSGAGYPGISSMDILGDSIPNISGEEPKIENEVKKILGSSSLPLELDIISHVNRVPVKHGHSIIIHAYFENEISLDDVTNKFLELKKNHSKLYKTYFKDDFGPRPLRDLKSNDYFSHIGRVKQNENKKCIGLISMGHNLVRGAVGAALLNLELLHLYLNE